ncbi:MFS transporter [Caloramator sp. Dgby_cultured_2]|nr:MFS transporter [Caloramator sp. Dgby_cultured_2]WDU84692.1 MFS transporter [Caloramator sp. Dgby_cultured_2]
MATLSDRCKSKDGRRIPFMKYSAIPFTLTTVLVFWTPFNSESYYNALYLTILLLLFYLFMTMYVTPYFALLSELGHTPEERLNLSTAIFITWFLGFAVASQAPVIWNIFLNMGYSKRSAILITFSILSLIALIFLLIPVFTIEEKNIVKQLLQKLKW